MGSQSRAEGVAAKAHVAPLPHHTLPAESRMVPCSCVPNNSPAPNNSPVPSSQKIILPPQMISGAEVPTAPPAGPEDNHTTPTGAVRSPAAAVAAAEQAATAAFTSGSRPPPPAAAPAGAVAARRSEGHPATAGRSDELKPHEEEWPQRPPERPTGAIPKATDAVVSALRPGTVGRIVGVLGPNVTSKIVKALGGCMLQHMC